MRGRDWKRLAGYVVRDRVSQGYRSRVELSAATGITDRTLGNLERGQSVSAATLSVVERALGWAPGSAEKILEGGEPAPTAEDKAVATALADVDRAILRATPEELVRMRRLLEETTSREQADQWLLDALRQREEAARRAQRARDVS